MTKHNRSLDTVVLGAGPAGIAASIALEQDYLLLERTSNAGGGSGTIEVDGAVFDIGGHSFHTPHPEIRDLVFSSLEMFEQKRDARCFAFGEYIPYPFQKNFRQLTKLDVVEECALGLTQLKTGDVDNYEAFIQSKFGYGISKYFMMPYNQKLWGRDLKRLASNWTGERVAAPEGVKEKFDTSGGARKPLQDDTRVAYPARGGFGEIFKALIKKVKHVEMGVEVGQISWRKKLVQTMDGRSFEYKNLISSLPLNELLKILDDVPVDLIRRVNQLEYLSLKVVLVTIDHPIDTVIQRVYSAEPHIAAHKTALNHNSSDYLRSLPRHGIMAEVSYSAEKPLARIDVEKWVVENLLEMGLIKSASEVYKTTHVDLKYAYPVPTHDRYEILQTAKAWLEERQIFTVGRFGEWAYINSDEVLHRGFKLGKALRDSCDSSLKTHEVRI